MSKQKFEVVTEQAPERAVLVGIDCGDKQWPVDESLAELERLASTAGAETVYTMYQKLDTPNPRTFIGPGKAEELASVVKNLEADVVILDDELTPSQQSNLEKVVGKPVKVIDRTALILDIFALHATTREGRLQVKLAQNQYLLPRLRGMWSHLAAHRMGGGVGSRFGEGESQLEVDRRLIRKRIARIRAELQDVASNRQTQRKARQASGVFRIALAGYTNAGKSSLMNRLTGAGVLAYDKLFATLDSTTRQIELDEGCKATLTDTVGFIQKLPHKLVEAFHSTLDEIREADLICIVCDIASSQKSAQLSAVREVLEQINAEKIPSLIVYNKIDLMADRPEELAHLKELEPNAIFVSSLTGEGIDTLMSALSKEVLSRNEVLNIVIPYNQGRYVQIAHEHGYIIEESFDADGTHMKVRIANNYASALKQFISEE